YPPFHRLIRLILRSRDQDAGAAFAERLAASLNTALENMRSPEMSTAGVRVLGPAGAPGFRLKGYYRLHFQLQSPSAALPHQLLGTVLPTVRPPNGIEFTMDVDPLNML